jgi:hypothetical protein
VAGINKFGPALSGIDPENDFSNALELLRSGHDAEFRYGSILTSHSKLWIVGTNRMYDGFGPAITFSLEANLDSSRRDYLFGYGMEKKFRREVTDFLIARGQYVPLSRS